LRWCRSRSEVSLKGDDAFGLCVAGGLFLSQEGGEVLELSFEDGLPLVAVVQSGFEFAFA
jgi:hypothetical protein